MSDLIQQETTVFNPTAIRTLRESLWQAGYRPVAVYRKSKRPYGDGWQDRARQNPPEAVADEPVESTSNTGILCDGLRVVDIDVDDPTRAAQLDQLARDMLGHAPMRWRENSARHAYLYRAAEGAPHKRTVINRATDEKVEVLGYGQQVLAHGAHDSGVPLHWQDLVSRAELTAATEDQIGAFLEAASKLIGATDIEGSNGGVTYPPEQLEAVDITLFEPICRALPNNGLFDERNKWIGLAHAFKAAFRKDEWRGRTLFAEHAERWTDAAGNPRPCTIEGGSHTAEAFRVYDSLGDRHEQGAGYILSLARKCGVDAALIAAYEEAVIAHDFDCEPAPVPTGLYRRCPEWANMLQGSKNSIYSNTTNALTAFRYCPRFEGVLRWNAFKQTVEVAGRPPWLAYRETFTPHDMTDNDVTRAQAWLQDQGMVAMGDRATMNALVAAAHDDTYHPVRDYLSGLEWDGVPRIDTWLIDHLGAEDTPLNRAFGAKSLIGAVARVMRPGCKLDTMLILEGPQGIGKSQALRALGGDWFIDYMPDLSSKDAMLQLQGAWIIEQAELASMKKGDVDRVKSFMSSPVDVFRAPYGRTTMSYPRQCALFGTINPGGNGYLKDETGDRRFWPVTCAVGWDAGRKIDMADLTRARDQIWAEARVRFERDELWWLDDRQLEKQAQTATDERYHADPWTDRVMDYAEGRSTVTTDEVLHALGLPVKDWTRADQMRVGGILRKAGWERRRDGGGNRVMRYHNPNHEPATDDNVVQLRPGGSAPSNAGARGPLAGLYD